MDNERTFLPLTGLRKTIAKRMLESVIKKPSVTLHRTARSDTLLRSVQRLRSQGRPISLNDVILKTTAEALKRYPSMNGHVTPEGVHLIPVVNLGFACSVPGGLVVPVIKEVDKKDIDIVASERRDLVSRARTNQLKPWELMDGTFTVTNLGTAGIDFFTPIINPPQVGILGIGRIRHDFQYIDGRIDPIPIVGLSLTFDHAAIDGMEAATFLGLVCELFENYPNEIH